jgi:hypothetical protein
LGIRNISPICYRYADADIIPGSVDVPMQRVKLYYLGFLALGLGFKKVTINTQERYFEAVGEYGTITTMLKADLGKVLRFEGDLLAIHRAMNQGDMSYISIHLGIINAKFIFSPGYVGNGYSSPLGNLYQAIIDKMSTEDFNILQRRQLENEQVFKQGRPKGEFTGEAALFSELHGRETRENPDGLVNSPKDAGAGATENFTFEPRRLTKTSTGLSAKDFAALMTNPAMYKKEAEFSEDLLRKWKEATRVNYPTLLGTTAIAILQPCELGFPSGLLIEPFLPWISRLSKCVLQRTRKHMHESLYILGLAKLNTINFLRNQESYWYTFNYDGVTSEGFISWIFRDMQEVYEDAQDELKEEMLPTDDDGNPTEDHRILIFPDSISLLENFDPQTWATKINSINALSSYTFRPINMLWAQIIFIDAAIYYHLRGGWYKGNRENFEIWTKENLAVLKAIIMSWDSSWKEPKKKEEGSRKSTSTSSSDIPPPPPPSKGRRFLSSVTGGLLGGEHGAPLKRHDTENGYVPETASTEETANEKPNINGNDEEEIAEKTINVDKRPSVDGGEPENPKISASTAPPPIPPPPPAMMPEGVRFADDEEEDEENEDGGETDGGDDDGPPPIEANLANFYDWDLLTYLKADPDLVKYEDEEKQERWLERIAALFQLRSLFYIAYLTLLPDSSDVYLAENSKVEMPMI